ncbi:annexin-like protein rj4-like, partial [Trifolium pratense]
MATIVVHGQTSPVQDAEALHLAFKGWGADNKAIVAILGHRNVHQRQQIRKAYEELFEEDLIKRLESEISGDFE